MPSTHIPFDRANCVPSQRRLRVGRSRPSRGCDGLNPEEVGMKFRIFSPLRLLAQTVHDMGRRVLIVALGMAVSAPCLRAQNAAEANTDKQTIQMLLQRIERLESRVAQLEGAHAGATRTETATTGPPPARPPAPRRARQRLRRPLRRLRRRRPSPSRKASTSNPSGWT